MITVKKSQEISGEAYKLLSDTKAYICVLLKGLWVVFHFKKQPVDFLKVRKYMLLYRTIVNMPHQKISFDFFTLIMTNYYTLH